MFALMVGVIVGTYSSLFVASPIMVDTIKKSEMDKKVISFLILIKQQYFNIAFFFPINI